MYFSSRSSSKQQVQKRRGCIVQHGVSNRAYCCRTICTLYMYMYSVVA